MEIALLKTEYLVFISEHDWRGSFFRDLSGSSFSPLLLCFLLFPTTADEQTPLIKQMV